MRANPENDQTELLPLSPANPSRQPSSEANLPTNPGHSTASVSLQNPEELQDRLTQILIQISGADPARITPEARLIEDIGIDSLGFYEILIEADECLGIKIREEDLLKFQTVGDIQNHLRSMEQPDAQAT
ncbi:MULTISPECIES: acyl carrier protein [unclassified Cyanobium]|uniref:acyl carrier protein n=1 Tax=unclassified Cyanobium TaxID=2627006 RepID=UPI0020CC2E52|nr:MULTISPECIES: acyl carrier protein [unclassified Cyanobium]MCP9778618.1 acyl carrier protein [Cyanobium sp. Tous-M-B4]MCP9877872.1 acyl carrier protein [Cyanobium sp. A2C-AMD]